MTFPFGGRIKARSVVASLSIGLLLVPGCGMQEEGPTGTAPSNPSPKATPSVSVEPKVPASGSKAVSDTEKDLHKDLAPPVIKPGASTTPAPPPASKPGTP